MWHIFLLSPWVSNKIEYVTHIIQKARLSKPPSPQPQPPVYSFKSTKKVQDKICAQMCHFFVTHGVLFSCSIYPLIIKGFDFAQKEPFNLWLKEESMPGFVSWNIEMFFSLRNQRFF